MSITRKCPECEKEISYTSESGALRAEQNNQKCRSCANKGKEKLGKQGNFIRQCSICGKDVIYFSQRAYSISLRRFNCYCKDCRNKRFSRICPVCGKEIFMKNESRFERFKGKNCKSCETLKRVSEKRGFGFSGTFNGISFRSSIELSFMMNEKRKFISGESSKFAIEYELQNKKHIYYPDFIVENEMIVNHNMLNQVKFLMQKNMQQKNGAHCIT